jgi:hypothetical protein
VGKKTHQSGVYPNSGPTLLTIPIVEIAPCPVLLDAVTLLDLAFDLVAVTGTLVKVIIRQLAPLLLDFAF